MGFWEERMRKRLIKRWKRDPGGPVMTVKAMASAYLRFQNENPTADHHELMRLALAQRGELLIEHGLSNRATVAASEQMILQSAGGSFPRLIEEITRFEAPPDVMSDLLRSPFYDDFKRVVREAVEQSGVPLDG